VIVTSSFVDVVIISILAYWGILMKPLSINILFGIFAAAAVLALVLDQLTNLKVVLFRVLTVV
jgi:hypothetical protein